jgi:hypothetical protein
MTLAFVVFIEVGRCDVVSITRQRAFKGLYTGITKAIIVKGKSSRNQVTDKEEKEI